MGRTATIQDALVEATDHYDAGRKPQAEKILNQIANQHPDNPEAIALLGVLSIEKGNAGVAIQLLKRASELAPTSGQIWNNLAAAYMAGNHPDEAVQCYEVGLEHSPDDADLLANHGSVYADSGRPHDALKWLDRALEIDPEHSSARWNKSLALLTLRRWAEGWPLHEVGDKNEEGVRHIRNYDVPRWTGEKGQTVIVSGEQGLGDEIMYMSCIPDLIEDCKQVIVDCHPRLVSTWRAAFPELRIYGTRKEEWITWTNEGEADAWVSIGSLPGFYRNKDADFPGTPFLKADEHAVKIIRNRFEQLGPGPFVGVTWFGGRKPERIAKRSVTLEELRPVLELDGTFISLQYDRHMADPHVAAAEEAGLKIHHYPDVLEAWDYYNTVNFTAACDLVIGVCQTINHVAGALGVPHWVLVGDRPTWREGIVCSDMPWYESIHLYRRSEGADWAGPIERIAADYRENML